MARRQARTDDDWQPRPRRRWVRRLLLTGVAGVVAAWFAPAVVVRTDLRDRPLELLFAGIDGRVTSREAAWNWWDCIEYRDVVLRDRAGRPLVAVPRVVIDRGLASLLVRPTELGAVRLIGGEALVEVRRGGSTLEDVLAPWLSNVLQTPAVPVSFELEIVDAAVELVDLERRDAWRITDLLAAGTVRPGATLAGWTISGRTRHSGVPLGDPEAAANRIASDRVLESAGPAGRAAPAGGIEPAPPAADAAPRQTVSRLDRTTVAAGATAILARPGGWSVSSPDTPSAASSRTLAVAATRMPLGISSVLATRFDAAHVLDGLADLRLDITLPPPSAAADARSASAAAPQSGFAGTRVAGVVSGSQLAVCRSDTLAELVTLERGDLPIDVSVEGDRITVRSLKMTSPLFRAEASGRIRLPAGGGWDWAEALVGDDFAVAADVDLAAAARAMPGGLAVRPDVRVTGGQLQLSAVARADGKERVLEVRAGSRDLAAVQSIVASDDATGGPGQTRERLLRWSEPFTAWVRGRRGPARGDRLRIEEARIASPAVEVSGAGTAEAATVQWTVDLGSLAAEAGEVLDLADMRLAGAVRGRLDLERVAAAASRVRVSASLSNFELQRPGRPAWRDDDLSIEAEGTGGMAGTALLLDDGHAVVTAADDRLEVALTGATLVNLWPATGSGGHAGPGRRAAWLRAAAGGEAIAADWSVGGELSRWQPRWEGLFPGTTPAGVTLGGMARVTAALTAQGDAWQVTRAGGEVEKLTVTLPDRQITEPRAVLTAAGRWHPAADTIEISSAELLTPTLSLRTGGLTVLPPRGPTPAAAGIDGLFEHAGRLRGKLQWQADAARLERWLVPRDVCDRWPASGRMWGTAEVLDTPIGTNLLVEATGSQLALATAAVPGRPEAAAPGPLWNEPRATLVLEVTCPPAVRPERLTVNQFKVDSSTVAVAATGAVDELSTRRLVDLGGTVAYDWEQVSRLATPWTGGRLRLAGAGARPFALRGPLGRLAVGRTAAAGPVDAAGQITLPEDWLADGRTVRGAERIARVALPLESAAADAAGRDAADLFTRLRALSVDTSAAWNAAEVAGLHFDAGEMPVRWFEGQLALGPFDLAASGGRLRGAPWLRFLPAPAELIVPPGRCLDRAVLSPQLCDRWVQWIVPLIGRSTRTQGLVSVDLAGARLPLADPFAGEAAGQLLFENLESTPDERVQPLVNLIVKLQSAIDPRFAFGDKAVLLRVRPEPVRVRLADRRLWHEGLVMDAGQLVIRSGGSVGADGTLAMAVEVAFRGDIMGAAPVVGTLLRTPLVIPLKGTVSRPQFDARSLDMILGRIVENTAEAVIGPQLSRGLETLFGNPPPPDPPPAAPGGLSFPPTAPDRGQPPRP